MSDSACPHPDPAAVPRAWERVARGCPPALQLELQALREWLASQPHALAQLLSGRPISGLQRGALQDDSAAQALAQAVVLHVLGARGSGPARVHAHSKALQDAERWTRWLHDAHLALEAASPAVRALPRAQTPLLVPVRLPSSPFAPEHDERAAQVQRWRQAFIDRLVACAHAQPEQRPARMPATDPVLWQAALLLSAVFFGALLDPDKLRQWRVQAWHARLGHGPAGDVWVAFRHAYEGRGPLHLQRWLLDPVTRLLWLQRPSGADPSLARPTIKNHALLDHARRWLGVPDLPTSLRELVSAARHWWHRHAPAAVLATTAREITNFDLHDASWQPLMGADAGEHAAVRAVADDDQRCAPDASSSPDGDDVVDRVALQHAWLAALRDALHASDRDARAQSLADAQAWVDDVHRPLLQWVVHVMQRRTAAAADTTGQGAAADQGELALHARAAPQRPRPPSRQGRHSIPAYAPTGALQLAAELIVRDLWGKDPSNAATPDDPAPRSPEFVAEALAQIVLDGPSQQEVNAREWAVHDWLRYLARDAALSAAFVRGSMRGVQRLVNEQLQDVRTLKAVDAELIDARTYREALAYLSRPPSHWQSTRRWQAARLLLVLGFRTGMRRQEMLGLRLCDVPSDTDLMLLVRPHARRRLKTPAATRAVPAGVLLDVQERRWLRQWLAQRRQECSLEPEPGQADVFGVPGHDPDHPDGVLSHERLADLVIEALTAAQRQLGQQPRARLHHLRHAFATWMTLALHVPTYPELLELFAHDPPTQALLRRGARLRRWLLGVRPAGTRAIGYALARLLGHIAPEVSLVHYVHAQVFLQHAAVLRQARALPQALWVALTGLSQPTVSKHLARGGPRALVQHVHGARQPLVEPQVGPAPPTSTPASPPTSSRAPQPLRAPRPACAGAAAVASALTVFAALNGAPVPEEVTPAQIEAWQRAVQRFEPSWLRQALQPPLRSPYRHRREERWMGELSARLQHALSLSLDDSAAAMRAHLQRYRPSAQRSEVAFCGAPGDTDWSALRDDWMRYLRLLQRLQWPPEHVLVLLRRPVSTLMPPRLGDIPGLPPLLQLAPRWLLDAPVAFASLRSAAHHPTNANWVGIRLLDRPHAQDGQCFPWVTAVTMALALVGAGG